jgi:hypothetical protein
VQSVRWWQLERWPRGYGSTYGHSELIARSSPWRQRENLNWTPYVRNAQYMLDWSGRLVALWPDGGENAPAAVLVTHAMVAQALRTTGKPFTDDEVAIRDTFDHFFDHLARFERLVTQGLVTDYNLKPYLGYWCNLLAGARPGHERPYTAAIKTYLNTYGYKDSAALIQRFAGERAVAADN